MRRSLLTFVLGSLSVATAACGGSSTDGDIGSTSSAVSVSGNEKTAYEFFVGKGLKNFQAAGIVGNLEQESSLDPTVYQYGGGPGRGIAQWSAGGRWDSDTDDNVVWYAHKENQSQWSLDLQLEFVWYELATFSSYGLGDLRASSDVGAATIAFQDRFEGCGECDQSNRIAYAEAVLAAFGKEPPAPKPTPIPKQATTCGVIDQDTGLKAGESLLSCDGRFELAMQDDGNLVWYGPKGALWASGTDGKGGHVAVMQSDGNFVLYDADSGALWASGTSGHDGSHLALQDDGNLVVYGPGGSALWASHTVQTSAPTEPCGELASGKSLAKGEEVTSCSGGYTFVMQTDGNLVQYDADHKALWASGTVGEGDRVDMQGDGDLVVYASDGKAVWASDTQGHDGAYFAVQTDGNIVVYTTAGKAIWARFGL